MKKICMIALVAMASTAAMAQAPAGTAPRTSQESNATTSGGKAADSAQTKTEARKGETMMMGADGRTHRMKTMDANGDGMITQKEYNSYHSGMWKKMKLTNGKASAADVEATLNGGPN